MKAFLAACAVLLAAATAGNALAQGREPLGRLFLTPEKRDALERQRAANVLESVSGNEEPALLVNGQVQRSSGKRTTWINGQVQHADGAGTRAQRADRVDIDIADGQRTTVRVGETLDRGAQQTQSPLGDGSIVVHRQRPSAARR